MLLTVLIQARCAAFNMFSVKFGNPMPHSSVCVSGAYGCRAITGESMHVNSYLLEVWDEIGGKKIKGSLMASSLAGSMNKILSAERWIENTCKKCLGSAGATRLHHELHKKKKLLAWDRFNVT